MSTNDKIEDALTRHHIFVQRYAKGREKEAAQFIRGIIKRTASYLDEGGTEWSDNRLKKTLVDLTGYVNSMGDNYNENVIAEMTKFAEQEADFNYQVLDTNVNVSTSLPAPNQIQAAILVKPLEIEATAGYTMRQALASFTAAKATQIAQLITDGYVLGETTEQIVQRILGIEGTQRRQAETLARTITNHMSSAARELTMRENEDVLDGWKWVATLDTRTTLICGTRDGKVYPLDGEVAFPPAHFNCRSTAVFNVKDEYDLGKDLEGQRPSKGADGTKQIGANTSYEEWLRKQPPEFQDEILGKDKADLFRKGNVPFDRFVDERGNPVSLDRLKELDQQFNGMPVAKAVPPVSTVKATKPVVTPKAEPESMTPDVPTAAQNVPTAVLHDIFTTSKVVTKENLDSMYAEIGTPEMLKLQEFVNDKRIKVTIVKDSQYVKGSKASKALMQEVYDYLVDDIDPEPYYKEWINKFTNQPFRNADILFAGKRTSNGFTSSSFRHVAAKERGAKKFDTAKSAENLKAIVREFANRPVGLANGERPWSLSGGMSDIYLDKAGAVGTTVLHELGHQVHFYAGMPTMPAKFDRYLLTEYGSVKDVEKHAEHFVAWVVDREALAARSLELAEYFDDLVAKALNSKSRASRGI